jgi:hypothetical protein
MLKRTNQNVKFCYERAVTASQEAANARTPMDRNFWLDRERSWVGLATSHDYQERLAGFIQELRTLPRRPICPVCDVPMRAKQFRCRPDGLLEFYYECPACEAKKAVVEIEAEKPFQSI